MHRNHMKLLGLLNSGMQGSCGLLLGAIFAQPLFPVSPAIKFWLGQVVGYFVGSVWFVIGAFAQIADVAAELQASAGTAKPDQ